MSSSIYRDLAWLPAPPPDFRAQCRELAKSDGGDAATVRRLAAYALGPTELTALAKAIATLRERGVPLAPLVPFKLGVLGNGTLDLLLPALVASAARYGIDLECVKGDYDQSLQDAVSPASAVNTAKPEAVLLALDYRGLPLRATPGADEAELVEPVLDYLAAIRRGIAANSGARCIVQTLAAPAETLFGSLDRAMAGAVRRSIDRLNLGIVESLTGTQDVLLDVGGLAETVGLADWHDAAQWNLAKLPFSADFLPVYADQVARLIGALRGKSRRCLVLDLDNTVWGGVIGDDGLEGIKLAQGDATGEAFLAVQRWALALRDRGVVLAVASKNTDEIAREVFRSHPEMLLREDHVAVFQANWEDKATNIKAIAEALSLGLESLVFLDDNPVERGLVRQLLPQVAVPELPDDPALYVRTLAAAGYFETTAFSQEDRGRAAFYQDNARRVRLREQAGDLDAYLASLEMEITFQPFDAVGRARIAQLVNKSNQFNLTTRRYDEADIAAFEEDPRVFALQVRLADAFGDNGMISVVICRPSGDDAWEIDTWLMSCRVLKRGVERMVLRELLAQAWTRGVETLIGVYRPTDRNGLVSHHYRNLGFEPSGTSSDGSTFWTMRTDRDVEPAPMSVRRLGLEGPRDAIVAA